MSIDTIREARNKLCELELNLCNYDDNDVRLLQNNMLEGVAMLDEALAALSTIEADAKPKTGWMIGKHNLMPMWWNGCPKRECNGAWSSDPKDGIKFSTKIDAELCAIAQGYSLSKVQIIDYLWG